MKKNHNKNRKLADLRNIIILQAIALIIGIFHIASTVIISKDGVLYISFAQKVSQNLKLVLQARPGGFPVMIFAANKIASFAGAPDNLWSWIYPAQITVLITRLITILFVYCICKTLVKKQNALWACLILIFLPYPADIGVDVLRGWPALVFISAAYACLFYALQKAKVWTFALAGLFTALAYFIRPFAIQVMIAAIAAFIFILFRPAPKINRLKALLATLLMLTVFSACLYPYITYSQKKFPAVIDRLIKKYTKTHTPQNTLLKHSQASKAQNRHCENFQKPVNSHRQMKTTLAAAHLSILASAQKETFLQVANNFLERLGEMLLWFFLPAWIIGTYIIITRKQINPHLRYLFALIIILNIAGIITRYISHPDMSRRYFLPLVVLSAPALPLGLKQISYWIDSIFKKKSIQYGLFEDNCGLTFLTLVSIGILICFPKLLRPKNIDKTGYLTAAKWINKNALPNQSVRVPDKRIGFYAQRNYTQNINYKKNEYFVFFLPDEQKMIATEKMTELFRVKAGKGDKKQVALFKKSLPAQIPLPTEKNNHTHPEKSSPIQDNPTAKP